jgi:hypothetical protein
MNESENKVFLILSLPLSILIIIISCFGLFNESAYSNETLNWQAQAFGQDFIDLFLITPVLIITSILIFKKKHAAILLWIGAILYLNYTFIIYCFAVHFNRMFYFYCLTLGLSFYSFIYFFFSQAKKLMFFKFNDPVPVKPAGIYLMAISILFYLLWLSQVIPAMLSGSTPKEIIETGLPVNPVHAIDLSICLPGIFLTGLFLLKKKRIGLLFTPGVLLFTILMDITIAVLTFFMKMKGIESDLSVSIITGLLALAGIFILIKFMKTLEFA